MGAAIRLSCLAFGTFLQLSTFSASRLAGQDQSVGTHVTAAAAEICRCGRWTCQACQQQKICPPTIICPPFQTFPSEPPRTAPGIPESAEPLPFEMNNVPSTGDGLSAPDLTSPLPPSPAPTPNAANLFAANQAAAAGAFGSSLLGATTPEMMGDFFGPGGVPSVIFDGESRYNVPIPTGAYNLGRVKQAENSTPIPTDRFFINYSLFDGVPLAAEPITVNRWMPGFEKTFLDGAASVEMRVPIGTSSDTSINLDGVNSDSRFQFGNLFFTLKGLMLERQDHVLTAGLSILVPTADDVKVFSPGGVELLRVVNESTHVMPFIGGAFTRGNRLFAQWILQVDVDTNGSSIFSAPNSPNSSRVGKLQDFTLLYADTSLGYWLYRSSGGGHALRGIAPIAELHYNRAVSDADRVADGSNFVFQTIPDLDNLNITAGLIFQLHNRTRLAVGYATPLGNSFDRVFDNELRVTLNRFF